MNHVHMRQCRRKVENMKNVIGSIRPLVNGRGLLLECARIFHETLLVPVLINKEKERSRIRDVQMNNVRGLLGIRRMDSPKCMDKGVMRSDEGSR